MTLDDRLTRGFIAGILAGLPSLAWGLFSQHVLHFSTLLYADFAAILIFGRKAQSLPANLFSQLGVFIFWGFLGIAFAYLVRYFGSKNLNFKGSLWGIFIWFSSYALTLLFKVPGLLIIPFRTAVSQFVGGLIWGFFLALALEFLNKRAGNQI